MKESFVWVDPERMGGTPCFRGTRVPVQNLFDYVCEGYSLEEFLDHFPSVKREQATDALASARAQLFATSEFQVAA